MPQKIDFKAQKIVVNALQINRYTIVIYLAKLFKKFPYPHTFHFNDIKSSLSEKVSRAILGVSVGLQFIEEGYEDSKREKSYRFTSNRALEDLILDFADMGNNDTDILAPIENKEKE